MYKDGNIKQVREKRRGKAGWASQAVKLLVEHHNVLTLAHLTRRDCGRTVASVAARTCPACAAAWAAEGARSPRSSCCWCSAHLQGVGREQKCTVNSHHAGRPIARQAGHAQRQRKQNHVHRLAGTGCIAEYNCPQEQEALPGCRLPAGRESTPVSNAAATHHQTGFGCARSALAGWSLPTHARSQTGGAAAWS